MGRIRLVNTFHDYLCFLMTESQFRDRLVWARSKRGVSQHQLAEAAVVAPAQISRYEAGRALPRPQIVAKLAEALSVDLEWMLSGRGIPSEDLPPYPGKTDRAGWIQIWIPSDLYDQLKRSAGANGLPLELEASLRLKRSLSTEMLPGTIGMQELHAKVEELQRFIRSSMEQDAQSQEPALPSPTPFGEVYVVQGVLSDAAGADRQSPSVTSTPEKNGITDPPRKITKVIIENHDVQMKDTRGKRVGQVRTIPVEVRKKRTFIKKVGPPKP